MEGFDQYSDDKTKLSQLWDLSSFSVSSYITAGRFANDYAITGSLLLYGTDYVQKNFSDSFCEVKVGVAIKFDTLADTNAFLILKSDSDDLCSLSINSAGRLIFHRGTEQNITPANLITQSNPGVINSNSWNYLEVYVKTSGSQSFEAYLNGTSLISYLPVSQEVSAKDLTGIKLFGLYEGFFGTSNVTYDDLYVKVANTLTGSTPFTSSITEYLGSAIIKTAYPSGQFGRDGTYDQTGSISNLFNPLRTNDGDTSYVYFTSSVTYPYVSFDFYGYGGDQFLNSGDTIKGFSNNILAKSTSGSLHDVKFLLLDENDVTIDTSPINGTLTTDYKYFFKIYDNTIITSSYPSTAAELNNLMFGILEDNS
jgi:hypothetical protein